MAKEKASAKGLYIKLYTEDAKITMNITDIVKYYKVLYASR
ncbi:hypothetical protein [uncultured Helcococcus sp.]|nr:hypothetical protein [uncultured Helcococcus sp.]